MQCVILAGGLGNRMRRFSGDLPKAIMPVLGKPFLFYQLEWLALQNVRRVVLSIGYGGNAISAAVGKRPRIALKSSSTWSFIACEILG